MASGSESEMDTDGVLSIYIVHVDGKGWCVGVAFVYMCIFIFSGCGFVQKFVDFKSNRYGFCNMVYLHSIYIYI